MTQEKGEDVIDVGCWVNVTGFEPDEEEETIYIVEDVAAKPTEMKVGKSSPLAKALLGRQAGDEFQFQTPGGEFQLTVVSTGQTE